MRLIECYIENFGKLSKFRYSFEDGLNVIKEDNGYGKTTLTVFIKSMLYGLESTKRSRIESNERKHYLPWNEGRCGGTLKFEANGKKYAAERTFAKKASDDSFKLYDLKTGKESLDFTESLGEELFGIDADGFERTVFLSEANLSGKNENKTVSAKLSDLVGCDGDMSVMDDALLRLEEQRKFYYKRGGAGEIGELTRRVSELEREINDLVRKKTLLADDEARLASLNKELTDLYQERTKREKEARLAGEARLRRVYIKQYKDMSEALARDEEKKSSLLSFFKNGIPTLEEVEKAKEWEIESKRIYHTLAEDESGELGPLTSFFAASLPNEEYEKARKNIAESDKKRGELSLIKSGIKPPSEDKTLPKIEDINSEIENLARTRDKKKSDTGTLFPIALGLILTAVGIILALLLAPVFYALAALGALTVLISSIRSFGKNKGVSKETRDSARELLESVGMYGEGDITEALYKLRAEAETRERLREENALAHKKAEALEAEISQLDREACEFISHFPVTNKSSVADAVYEILRKRDIYLALIDANRLAMQKKEASIRTANEYAERSRAFLNRFPTVSARPFDEISAKAMEYSALSRSVERTRLEVEKFRVDHGITDTSEAEGAAIELSAAEYDPALLSAKISELESAKAVLQRQCRLLSDEIDRIDELAGERDALEERIKDYERKLAVIRKTSEYLVEAKDALTARYLSKTKSAFDKYISLIGRDSGEAFKMDTSFTLMKNEGGIYRETEAYSRGTRDIYSLAARLSLIDSLYEGEKPFIILDDPFAYFDDASLKRAVSILSAIAKEKQVIYLTCTSARVK